MPGFLLVTLFCHGPLVSGCRGGSSREAEKRFAHKKGACTTIIGGRADRNQQSGLFRAVPAPRGPGEQTAVHGASLQWSQRTLRTLRLKASPRDVVVKPPILLLQSPKKARFCRFFRDGSDFLGFFAHPSVLRGFLAVYSAPKHIPRTSPMRVPIQEPLFARDELEDHPSPVTIRELLATIPDRGPLEGFLAARGWGRSRSPRGPRQSTFWRGLL